MDGTDTSAGEESGNGLPGHWHVDGDGVTLLDSHILEDIGYAANFTKELSIGDFAAFILLIGLVDDCSLLRENLGESTIEHRDGVGQDEKRGVWMDD